MRPKSTDYIATEAEALTLLETILSSREEGSSKRIYLPRVRLCCAECGQEFIVMGYQFHKHVKRGFQKWYCTKKCFDTAEAKKWKEHRDQTQICARCGKPVGGVHSRARTVRKYCPDCIGIVRRERWDGKRRPPVPAVCPVCGKDFLARDAAGYRQEFCSKECADRAHGGSMTGSANIRWKGGATKRRAKGMRDFYHVKKLVRERDKVCAVCGTTENLQFHHVDLDPGNNAPQNVVRVCADCHKEIHRQEFYGEYETKFLPAIRRYLAQMDALSSTSKSPTATTSLPTESLSTTAS